MATVTIQSVSCAYANGNNYSFYPNFISEQSSGSTNLYLGYFRTSSSATTGYKNILCFNFTVDSSGYYNFSFNTIHHNGTAYNGRCSIHSLITTIPLSENTYNPYNIDYLTFLNTTDMDITSYGGTNVLTSDISSKNAVKLTSSTHYYLWMWGEAPTSGSAGVYGGVLSSTADWLFNAQKTNSAYASSSIHTTLSSSSIPYYTITCIRGNDVSGITSPECPEMFAAGSLPTSYDKDGNPKDSEKVLEYGNIFPKSSYSSGMTMKTFSVAAGTVFSTAFIDTISYASTRGDKYRNYISNMTPKYHTSGSDIVSSDYTINSNTTLYYYFTGQTQHSYDVYYYTDTGSLYAHDIVKAAGETVRGALSKSSTTETDTISAEIICQYEDQKTTYTTISNSISRTNTRNYTFQSWGGYAAGSTIKPSSNMSLTAKYTSSLSYGSSSITLTFPAGYTKTSDDYDYTFTGWKNSSNTYNTGATKTFTFSNSTTKQSITVWATYSSVLKEWIKLIYKIKSDEGEIWKDESISYEVELSSDKTIYNILKVLEKSIVKTEWNYPVNFFEGFSVTTAKTTTSTYGSDGSWKDQNGHTYKEEDTIKAKRKEASSVDIELTANWGQSSDSIQYTQITVPGENSEPKITKWSWTSSSSKINYTYAPGDIIEPNIVKELLSSEETVKFIATYEDFPAYMYINGNWRKGTFYVYANSKWNKVQPYIYDNGSWKTVM